MPARHAAPRRSHRVRNTVIGVVVAALVAVISFGVYEFTSLKQGLQTSTILEPTQGATSAAPHADTNILVMGLDSRVDVNGDPLPADIYQALHAGDQSDGGLNTNVLMLLHIPGDGRKAVEISIPRDDQVELVGCPDGECSGKIKQAYGLAVDQEQRRLANESGMTKAEKYKAARDAGRKAEVQTVEKFLDVTVDHFVEVTMVAFYQLAQVVQPITVCVLADTQDTYSGADFKKGKQEINAQQALAFVRQRRDNVHPELNFTDLDRSRRQQAFIVSVASQLKNAGTLANPVKLNGILDVVKKNTVIDSGLDLISFAGQASSIAGGNVSYYTLPVKSFGKNERGEDVNIVDVNEVRATVKLLIAGKTPGSPTTSTGTSSGTSSGSPTKPPTSATTAPGGVPTPVPAGSNPAPTDLSELGGGGIPCVK